MWYMWSCSILSQHLRAELLNLFTIHGLYALPHLESHVYKDILTFIGHSKSAEFRENTRRGREKNFGMFLFFYASVIDNQATRSLSVTGMLTQLLGNSRVFLFIHQAESNVLIVEIVQNLGCKLDEERGWGSWEDKEKILLTSHEGWFYRWLIWLINPSVHDRPPRPTSPNENKLSSFIYMSNLLAFQH